MIKILMDPMSKPRQTRSDVWRQRPIILRWRAWADEIRAICKEKNFVPSNELLMEFHIKIPKSYSKKKRAEHIGQPHIMNRLDVDNLAKAVMDALIKDDGRVHFLQVKKFWAEEGYIILQNKMEILDASENA